MPNQALEQTRDNVLRYGEVVGCELLNFFVRQQKPRARAMKPRPVLCSPKRIASVQQMFVARSRVNRTAVSFATLFAATLMSVIFVHVSEAGEPITQDAETSSVGLACDWLINHQLEDGGWSFDLTVCPGCRGKCRNSAIAEWRQDRAGATAMALLPLLASGSTQKVGPYKQEMARGIGFLVTKALAGKGKVFGDGGNMHSQALACIALSECYSMSQDREVGEAAQMTLDFIASEQGTSGGWGRSPGAAGDTTTLGWQVMALRSGNMAYLKLSPPTITSAARFLEVVAVDAGAAYGSTDNSNPNAQSTAAGLFCRRSLGYRKEETAAIGEGIMRLTKVGPTEDIVYDYFATQVMLSQDVNYKQWCTWRDSMRTFLIRNQSCDGHERGSWLDGVSGGAAAQGGRLYCTALATLILEARRRLPLFREELDNAEEFNE